MAGGRRQHDRHRSSSGMISIFTAPPPPLYSTKVFFPNLDPLAGILATYATFAVGFLVRPFGGVLFGHFGDKYGRKPYSSPHCC